MCAQQLYSCVLLTELCPNRGKACVRSYGESNNTSGLVACEQPEAKANLRPNTQAVLGFPPLVPARITSPRDSCGHLLRLVSYQPFQGSLRSFVPRFSYLSNTSPPASCLALLPFLRLSFFYTYLPSSLLYSTADLLLPLYRVILLLFLSSFYPTQSRQVHLTLR